MTWEVKDGGTWRELLEAHVKVSGTWQAIQEGWVKVSGTWQQFYSAVALSISATSSMSASVQSDSEITVRGTIVIRRNGTVSWTSSHDVNGGFVAPWADPTFSDVGDDYEARLTVNSGTSPDGGNSTGTFHTLSSDRSWWWESNTLTGKQANVTLTVRKISDTGTSASDTFDISVLRQIEPV